MLELLQFEHFDWKALEDDLINWTPDQLYIIAKALIRGDNADQSKGILAKRSYLYGYIITIADSNTITVLFEDFEFLFLGETKPLDLLFKIKKKTDVLFFKEESGKFDAYLTENLK